MPKAAVRKGSAKKPAKKPAKKRGKAAGGRPGRAASEQTRPDIAAAGTAGGQGEPRSDLAQALSRSQQFYIRGNMEVLSVARIASDLSLPVDVVRAYIATVASVSPQSRTSKLFQRPARGVVAMTEAASMRADDFRKGSLVTQAEINQAAAAGNYDLAAELARQREEGIADYDARRQASQGHFIHRPRGSGGEPEIDGGPPK